MDPKDMLAGLESALKPYKGEFPSHRALPQAGRSRQEILEEMRRLKEKEESRWRQGYVSGGVYHGDEAHIQFLNEVYALHSQSNPLHADIWPSTIKFEAEIVAMTARMLGSERTDDPVCGTVSSGGTESILLAMKTYRDWARATKGITAPEIIAPVTAHAAFDKAAQYFGLRLIRTPLDADYAADVAAVEAAITPNTVAMIGSAPSFPHGVVDPIEALSELARARGIGFHTDGCLGGFLLPWAERLGFPVPAFDFRLPGVTSISADTHKFGYAAKGSSVVLYRTPDLRRYQYYATADWPGGLYFSPTFAGSRPGALSAVCWAAMMSIGEQGYLQAAKRILETTAWLREGVAGIPGLHLIGRSLFIVAFASHEVDVYAVLDALAKKQWNLNGLQNPASLHLCITQRHTQPGVAEAFIADLQAAVEHVRRNPQDKGTMGVVYGLAGSVPVKSLVADFLKTYIDLMYRVD